MNEIPDFTFEPFGDYEDDDVYDAMDLRAGDSVSVQTRMIVRFTDQDDIMEFMGMLLTHLREHGSSIGFAVTGQLYFTHDDDSLPPSPVQYDRLPMWLKQIVDAYRKTEARALLAELSRLRSIIEAVESSGPDSCFSEIENRHRAIVRTVQNRVFGSREALRERLGVALDALKYYAEKDDGERARIALSFSEGDSSQEDRDLHDGAVAALAKAGKGPANG